MIYDLVYNDCGEYVVISPQEIPFQLTLVLDHVEHTPEQFVCAHRHTLVFVWKGLPYQPKVTLRVNGRDYARTVSQYPDFAGKVLLSTLVLHEEKWIKQWIQYHIAHGVDHIIVYDNERGGKGELRDFLHDEIAAGIVLYIPWAYPYRMPRSGISGQTTQQNHSIYTWRRAAYIGLLDVDEYVIPREGQQIRAILDRVASEKCGGVELVSRIFAPPAAFNKENSGSYDFLRATRCTDYIYGGRQKVFVIPAHVEMFSVHMIVTGEPKHTADPEKDMCFYHYWFLSAKPVRDELSMPCSVPPITPPPKLTAAKPAAKLAR